MAEASGKNNGAEQERVQPPAFHEALRTWAYIGFNRFGGPAGQIAIMHQVLIAEPGTLNWQALALSPVAIIAVFRFHVGTFKVLAGCASGGVAIQMLWP